MRVYEKVPFVCNKCEIVEDGVKFEYLDAESLSEHLDSMLQRGKSRLHLIGLWSFEAGAACIQPETI